MTYFDGEDLIAVYHTRTDKKVFIAMVQIESFDWNGRASALRIEVTSESHVRVRARLARSPPPICYQRLQLSRFCCAEIATTEEIA